MTKEGDQVAVDANPPARQRWISLPLYIGAILVASGAAHLAWLVATNAAWEGPLSPRKPALFGLSAGVTVWSIVWVLTKLHPQPWDRLFAGAMAGGLLAEVSLITLQYWRGVPSHFNRSTFFDTTLETSMLALIVAVTVGIFWLSWRSLRLPPIEKAFAVALRGGLWLLTISCVLGIGVTILGEMNLAEGKPPEIWGPAGVLKYPHGVALHAIQTLPLLAWLLVRLRAPDGARVVRAAVWAHVFLLGAALWQTLRGRARFDGDWLGLTLYGLAGLVILAAVASSRRMRSNRYSSDRP